MFTFLHSLQQSGEPDVFTLYQHQKLVGEETRHSSGGLHMILHNRCAPNM